MDANADMELAEALGIETEETLLTVTQVYLPAVAFLTLVSLLWTGFNVGLTSLDIAQLQVLLDVPEKEDSSQRLAKYARRVLPLRRKGNLLLCTVLAVTTVTRTLIVLCLEDCAGTFYGWLIATGVIFLLAELLPQMVCTRHGLRAGSAGAPAVWAALALFYPITKPLALLLDVVFPRRENLLDRAQLRTLVEYQHAAVPGMLAKGQAEMMIGALGVAQATVEEVMVPLERAFTLGFDEPLDFELLTKVVRRGFTRIPVVHPKTGQVEGILHCKELLKQRFGNSSGRQPSKGDSEGGSSSTKANQTAGDFLLSLRQAGMESRIYVCGKNTRLCTLLYEFKSSSHLAVVAEVDEPGGAVVDNRTGLPVKHIGIVTLHNMFEVILQMSEGFRESLRRRDHCSSMQMLNSHSLEAATRRNRFLSPGQAEAVASFLQATQPAFANRFVHARALRSLLRTLPILRIDAGSSLCKRREQVTFAMLILQGTVSVTSGEDRVESTVGPWSCLCIGALQLAAQQAPGASKGPGGTQAKEPPADECPAYSPDFSAYVASQGFLAMRFDVQTYVETMRRGSKEMPRAAGAEDGQKDRRESTISAGSPLSPLSPGPQDVPGVEEVEELVDWSAEPDQPGTIEAVFLTSKLTDGIGRVRCSQESPKLDKVM